MLLDLIVDNDIICNTKFCLITIYDISSQILKDFSSVLISIKRYH